jgi:hypothetical protein
LDGAMLDGAMSQAHVNRLNYTVNGFTFCCNSKL